jgi:MATE family multidrug resistance protein
MATRSTTGDAGGAGWAAEAAATLRLAWPLVLTNLAQMAITTTDVVMMGWLGPRALAAGTLGANVFFLPLILGFGIGMATAPMLAQAIGRRRHVLHEVRRTTRQGLWLIAFYCLPAWLVCWHTADILVFIRQDAELAAVAGSYVRAMQWGLLPALSFVVLRSFVSALERPAPALWITAAAIGFNAACDWALIFGNWGAPRMGVVGAGVASALANLFQFLGLLAVVLCDRRFRRFRLLGHWWRGDLPRTRELVRIALPISWALLFESTIINAVAFLIGLFGAAALAAHAIAIQVASITFMVPWGLSQAATVRVGLAAGRGDRNGVTLAGWTAISLGMGFMAMMAALLVGAPMPIIDLFLDLADPESATAVTLGVKLLAVAALFQVADGAQTVTSGALRGLKDTKAHMVATGIGYWLLGLPLGALLAFRFALDGVGLWLGLALGVVLVAVALVWRWAGRERIGLVKARPA